MRLLKMVLAWLVPPWVFWRRWSAPAALAGSAAWLAALACAALLWAGPGVVALFVISVTAGALELAARPAH